MIDELISVLGDETAQIVLKEYAGQNIVFSKRQIRAISQLIGDDNAEKMVKHFGKHALYIPIQSHSQAIKTRQIKIVERYLELSKTMQKMDARNQTAKEFNCSYTWVRCLVNRHKRGQNATN